MIEYIAHDGTRDIGPYVWLWGADRAQREYGVGGGVRLMAPSAWLLSTRTKTKIIDNENVTNSLNDTVYTRSL